MLQFKNIKGHSKRLEKIRVQTAKHERNIQMKFRKLLQCKAHCAIMPMTID